jgi:hypothetical protein
MNKRKRIKSKVSELLKNIEAKNYKGIEIDIYVGNTIWNYLDKEGMIKKEGEKFTLEIKKPETGNFNKGKKR